MFRILALLAGFALLPVAHAQTTVATNKRHALLVGVSKYPNLAERLQLGGSANDVLLLKKTIVEICGFPEGSIRILSEAEGEKNADRLPTRANIQREFAELAKRAEEGDTVFISLSGHGSQQPESNAPDAEPEPDGLDELFLPRDVGKWNNVRGTVENAIIDDELGLWLKAIGAKKASVFILVDACHSGTITRGTSTERMRQLDTTGDLGIPKDTLKTAENAANEREKKNPNPNKLRSFVGESPPLKMANKDGFVAIYAAQACEPTVEVDLPPDSPSPKAHGLLTYTFCQIVSESAAKSKKPLTYREITQRIHLHYGAIGRTFPTPVIEGADRDRQLFGDTLHAGRSSIQLAKSNDQYSISAGSVMGITPGSILAVMPLPGKGEEILGYVIVDSVSVSDSRVNSTKFESKPEVADLPVGGVCKVVSIDFGDMKRKLSIDPFDDNNTALTNETHEKLRTLLRGLDTPQSLARAVIDPKQADWLVRVYPSKSSEMKVILVPARGFNTSVPGVKPPAFGPNPDSEPIEKWLANTARTIAKSENLKAICGATNPTDTEEDGLRFALKLSVNGKEVTLPATNLHLFTGDKLLLTVINESRYPIDFTALYLDSKYGIDPVFPSLRKNEDNRLQVNQRQLLPMLEVNPSRASATEGIEYLAILAVQKTTEIPVLFNSLGQSGLAKLRSTSDATGFERLLSKGCYGEGKTRAVATSAEETRYRAQMLAFTIHKDRRPRE